MAKLSRYSKFKGTSYEYDALHHWVRKQLGRPQKCSDCGTTEERRYEWANISGEYKKDLSDWKRLCKICHFKYDRGGYIWEDEFCSNGHRLVLTNLRLTRQVKTSTGKRLSCLQCAKDSRKKYRLKNGKPYSTDLQVSKERHATELTEPFRAALMKEHSSDWSMETIAEAAYICAEVVQNALEKGEYPFN